MPREMQISEKRILYNQREREEEEEEEDRRERTSWINNSCIIISLLCGHVLGRPEGH